LKLTVGLCFAETSISYFQKRLIFFLINLITNR